MTSPPVSQVLLKPAGADCNLGCTYCFYLGKKDLYPRRRRRMGDEVLDAVCRQLLGGGAPSVSFGWQGGEPTLMGLPFFERAVACQRRHARPGQVVSNTLQTNGLLLDDPWCAFLRRYRFLVGLSIDGPLDLHDAYRVGTNGAGSFARVARAAARLACHGVETNALVVLTDRSVDRVEDIWRTLVELGLRHFQLIPCLESEAGSPGRGASWQPYAMLPERYGEVLCRLFDLWTGAFRDGLPTLFVRWFDALLFAYVGLEPPLCTLSEVCGQGLVVEHNGDVYACDFFVSPEWRLGNLLVDDLRELARGPAQVAFGQRKRELHARCRQCRWLAVCRGGCPRDRDHDPREPGLDPYCEAYRVFFEHADPRLRGLAETWRRLGGRGGSNESISPDTTPSPSGGSNKS